MNGTKSVAQETDEWIKEHAGAEDALYSALTELREVKEELQKANNNIETLKERLQNLD